MDTDNFDLRNNEKKKINNYKKQYFFNEGEVRRTHIGQNIGSEVYGKGLGFKRPVLILRKLSRKSCIVIPLTTKEKIGDWYYPFSLQSINRIALLHQIKMIDINRFQKKIGQISRIEFGYIKKKISFLLNLS